MHIFVMGEHVDRSANDYLVIAGAKSIHSAGLSDLMQHDGHSFYNASILFVPLVVDQPHFLYPKIMAQLGILLFSKATDHGTNIPL